MKNEIQIAKILRPHGIKGGLKISSNLGDIPFSKFTTVFVGDNKELMHIKRVQPLNNFLLLQIEEITSCDQAELYRNQGIYVDRTAYPEILGEIVFLSDYIGAEVFDENNKKIGVVVDVDNFGSADVISINCFGTTYMVPNIPDTLQFDKEKNIFKINSKRFLETRV